MLRKFDCFFLTKPTKKNKREKECERAREKKTSLQICDKKTATFLHYRLLQKRTHVHTCLNSNEKKENRLNSKHQPKATTETKTKIHAMSKNNI